MKNLMQTLSDDPNDYCVFDTETRGLGGLEDERWGNVTLSGAARYGKSCKVTILTYAIGDDPVEAWVLDDFTKTLRWADAPPKLLSFMARALKGEAWFAAFNSFFDRNVCNGGMVASTSKRVMLPVRTVIDIMAQAVGSNLPSDLQGASTAIGRGGKTTGGKKLIAMFAPHNGSTPQTEPEEWQRFIDYAIQDTDEARHVFRATRKLWRWEWEQFWASERINDLGLPIDGPFVERAAALAAVYSGEVNELVKDFTGGACWSVNQHKALAEHVYYELGHLPEACDILVKKYEEDEECDGLIVSSLSLERGRVEKLIAYLERLDGEKGLTDEEFSVLQLLEVRLYGASSTPKKFGKLLPMLDDRGRLCGQYTFNGAQQTGRFSSRGVQVHNLSRQTLDDEVGAIEAINELEI